MTRYPKVQTTTATEFPAPNPLRRNAFSDFGPAGGPEPGVLSDRSSLVAQRLPITAVSGYSDTWADFLCWRLIGPKSFYTGQCSRWTASEHGRVPIFFFVRN